MRSLSNWISACTRVLILLLPLMLVSAAPAQPVPAAASAQRADGPSSPAPALSLDPAGSCAEAQVPAALPVGLLETCDGVRPGMLLRIGGGECTANFVFTDGRRNYIGTAGHCLHAANPDSGAAGEHVFAPGAGLEVRSRSGRIGEFAYALEQEGLDFALIRLDDDVTPDPQMCHFGGPTGINDDQVVNVPVLLHYYGEGVVVGSVVPARTAVALGMAERDVVFAEGISVPGDSGAPVISDDGRAVGVLVGVSVRFGGGERPVDVGTVLATRLTPQLERARRTMRLPSLQLVTASTL